MTLSPHGTLIWVLWMSWVVYWRIAGYGTKPTSRHEGAASFVSHWLPLSIGLILIALPQRFGGWFSDPIWPANVQTYGMGVAMTVAGLAFTIWARKHLGANWSGSVTQKQGHELIRTGPYAWVRHPIYTGILLAMLGSVIALDKWRGLVGLVMVIAALIRKLSIEERFMTELFGDAYAQYRRGVRALIPGIF